MRMIVVAGFLTVALFAAVLGAIGAQPSVLAPAQEAVGPPHNVTQSVPVEKISDRWRG